MLGLKLLKKNVAFQPDLAENKENHVFLKMCTIFLLVLDILLAPHVI